MKLNVIQKSPPVLSEFGKGIEGSRALNFGLSGGKNCDTVCRHHPENGGACYAVRIENRPDREQLHAKLERHEIADPAELCRKALVELQAIKAKGKAIPWFRISTGGSVPKPDDVSPAFHAALRELLAWCQDNGIPVHFPVESMEKWLFYTRAVGQFCTVRLSCQSTDSFVNDADVACSVVIGETGQTRRMRVSLAKSAARKHEEKTGRRAIVCPAVATRYLNGNKPNKKAKCGNCTACSKSDVDIIYPLH